MKSWVISTARLWALRLISVVSACIVLFFLAVPWAIGNFIFIVAFISASVLPNYGKFLSNISANAIEDFVNQTPKVSLVYSLVLNGDISLEKIRSLFKSNVLDRKSSTRPDTLRYPELKQFLTSILGIGIWKTDINFQLEHHINQTSDFEDISLEETVESIHSILANKKYAAYKSPWEIILIRNVKPFPTAKDKKTTTEHNSIIACRFHHVLGDGKSFVKLFVECLGQKKLKAAVAKPLCLSNWDRILFYSLFPLNLVSYFAELLLRVPNGRKHPWIFLRHWREENTTRSLTTFSKKISLADIKKIAHKNNVCGSAVIMELVTGAIRDRVSQKWPVPAFCTLPKPNHPDKLVNHLYGGTPILPVHLSNVVQRLEKCNEEFSMMKVTQQGKYQEKVLELLAGGQMFGMPSLFLNSFCPVIVTNIAGDEEGFRVGESHVTDFRMSTGIGRGAAGVVFCIFSYGDSLTVSVMGKEGVMMQKDINKIADSIGKEFMSLLKIS